MRGPRGVLTAALGAGADFAGAGRAATTGRLVADGWFTGVAGPGLGVPETLASFGTEPGFPIGYVGVTGATRGEIRFRAAAGWADWQPLPPGDAGGVLVPAHGAQAYELRGTGLARALVINTTDGPPTAPPARARSFGGARYLRRAGWGADESLRFGPDGAESFPPAYFPVRALTVHHTATPNADPDPAATVRAIYFFHAVVQAFGDIGYHLLIDEAGTVYEGRWSGVSGPGGALLPNGAHTGGFNAGNVGVALLGEATTAGPTPAAWRSLVGVLATLARNAGLDPLGETRYVNPINGATKTVPTIAGHRDWLATSCPGETCHAALPAVRLDVAHLLAAAA